MAGSAWGPAAPDEGDAAGHQAKEADDQADDGQRAGRGRIVAYPLSKAVTTLSIELKGAEPLEVPLG